MSYILQILRCIVSTHQSKPIRAALYAAQRQAAHLNHSLAAKEWLPATCHIFSVVLELIWTGAYIPSQVDTDPLLQKQNCFNVISLWILSAPGKAKYHTGIIFCRYTYIRRYKCGFF